MAVQLVVLWFVSVFAVGFIAKNQGRNALAWLLAASLFSPILMLLLAFIIPMKREARERRRSGTFLLNIAAATVVIACTVGFIHSAEADGVGHVLASILDDKFKNNDTRIRNVHYPFYYSIPFLVALDVLPGPASGTFQLEHPSDLDSCKYQFYSFDLHSDGGLEFIVMISGEEIVKITRCLAAATTLPNVSSGLY